MKHLFIKDKTVILTKSVDGKQNYWKHVVFVVWKDVKFQKTFQVIETSRDFCLTFLTLKDCVCYILASFFEFKW